MRSQNETSRYSKRTGLPVHPIFGMNSRGKASGPRPDYAQKGVEIHVRSVFLQGLFFINIQYLDKYFEPVKDALSQLHSVARNNDISTASLSVNFVNNNQYVDCLVMGVDSKSHLNDLITAIEDPPIAKDLLNDILSIKVTDENMLLPYKWE